MERHRWLLLAVLTAAGPASSKSAEAHCSGFLECTAKDVAKSLAPNPIPPFIPRPSGKTPIGKVLNVVAPNNPAAFADSTKEALRVASDAGQEGLNFIAKIHFGGVSGSFKAQPSTDSEDDETEEGDDGKEDPIGPVRAGPLQDGAPPGSPTVTLGFDPTFDSPGPLDLIPAVVDGPQLMNQPAAPGVSAADPVQISDRPPHDDMGWLFENHDPILPPEIYPRWENRTAPFYGCADMNSCLSPGETNPAGDWTEPKDYGRWYGSDPYNGNDPLNIP